MPSVQLSRTQTHTPSTKIHRCVDRETIYVRLIHQYYNSLLKMEAAGLLFSEVHERRAGTHLCVLGSE